MRLVEFRMAECRVPRRRLLLARPTASQFGCANQSGCANEAPQMPTRVTQRGPLPASSPPIGSTDLLRTTCSTGQARHPEITDRFAAFRDLGSNRFKPSYSHDDEETMKLFISNESPFVDAR